MKRLFDDLWGATTLAIIAVTICFLLGPVMVAVFMSFDARTYLGPLPPPSFSLQWYRAFFTNNAFITGLQTSLLLATTATFISAVVGTMVALVLRRPSVPGKAALTALFLSPLMIPAVVIGFALLVFFSQLGIYDSFIRLLCAHLIITLPFTIRSTIAGMVGIPGSLVEAAMSLGANDRQAFWDITFPLAKTGIAAGCIFAFAHSLDDVAVSLFLYDTHSYTLPVALITHMRANFDLSIAAAAAFLAFVTLLLILVLDRTVGLNRVVGQGIYRP